MTPDLDQNLSLKASLEDKISPALGKIKQGVRDTRSALEQLVQATNTAESGIGRNADGMANKTSNATDRLQSDLKRAGGAFGDLGREAVENSEKVGNALKDALFTRDSSAKLKELDQGLKGLKSSLEGMASTSRPMNAKARRLQVIGQDTLNRKVIPAFQELHGTLDDFPDVLQEISLLEGRRAEGLRSMGSHLDGVNSRVSGFGETVDRIKFGIEDFLGGIMSGFAAIHGLKLREFQIESGRTGGARAFRSTEDTAAQINLATRAPMSVWKDAHTTLLDISKVAESTYPMLLDQMVNLSKTTGLATEEFANLYTQMSEIGQLRGDKWVDLSEKISYFATTSRASIEELADILKEAAGEMTRFSRESRAAYANAALANAAASADIGLGAGKAGEIYQNILDNPEVAARVQGLVGGGLNVFNAAMDPTQHQKLMAEVYEGAMRQGKNFGIDTYLGRQAFNQVYAGTGVDADTAAKITNFAEENNLTGRGQFSNFMMSEYNVPQDQQSARAKELAKLIRGTVPEQFEQAKSFMETAGFELGKHQMTAMEAFMGPGLDWAEKTALTLYDLNKASQDFFAKALVYLSLGQNVMSLLKKLPLIGGLMGKLGLGGAIGGALGAAGLAYGIHKVTSRGEEKKGLLSSSEVDALRSEGLKAETAARLVENTERIRKKYGDDYAGKQAFKQTYSDTGFDAYAREKYGHKDYSGQAAEAYRAANQATKEREEFITLYKKVDVGFRKTMREFESALKNATTDSEKATIRKSARGYVDEQITSHRNFYKNQEIVVKELKRMERDALLPIWALGAREVAKEVGGAAKVFGTAIWNKGKQEVSDTASTVVKAASFAGDVLEGPMQLIKAGAKVALRRGIDFVGGPGYYDQVTETRRKLKEAREKIEGEQPSTDRTKEINAEAGAPIIDPNGAFINAAALNMGAQSFDEMISRTNKEQVALQTQMVSLLTAIASGTKIEAPKGQGGGNAPWYDNETLRTIAAVGLDILL